MDAAGGRRAGVAAGGADPVRRTGRAGRGAFPGALEAPPDTAHGAALGNCRGGGRRARIFVCADLLRKPYCYIDGVAVYDAEVAMQTTVYLESFSALEESGRMVDELIENN